LDAPTFKEFQGGSRRFRQKIYVRPIPPSPPLRSFTTHRRRPAFLHFTFSILHSSYPNQTKLYPNYRSRTNLPPIALRCAKLHSGALRARLHFPREINHPPRQNCPRMACPRLGAAMLLLSALGFHSHSAIRNPHFPTSRVHQICGLLVRQAKSGESGHLKGGVPCNYPVHTVADRATSLSNRAVEAPGRRTHEP